MLTRKQRLQATLHYLRRPTREFLPVLGVTLALLVAGGFAFHLLYEQAPLTLGRSFYITYSLIFMEHLLPFPRHWLLQAFYIVLPPLGLVVILDGIIRFSYRLLRREDDEPDWMRAMTVTLSDHVVLFGLGNVGLRVFQELRRLGQQVAVVEKQADQVNLAFARAEGAPVFVGTGREPGLLGELGVERAKSVILATDDDLLNLEVALDARKLNPEIRVVMRMFDKDLAQKIREAFDIRLAFSTSELAAPLFASASSDASILNAFYVDEELLVVMRLCVSEGSALVGETVGSLEDGHRLHVLSHERGEAREHHPGREVEVSAGDLLTLQLPAEDRDALHRLNDSRAAG